MKQIGEIIREKNIVLETSDPVAQMGFAQVPLFVLKNADLSLGARVTYAMFLGYAWHNDSCFPGQDRLAKEMGVSRPSVTAFVNDLEKAGLVSIQRRGLGKTNIYTIHFRVKPKAHRFGKREEFSGLASGSQPADIKKSAE